jgi:hypothetical protein
MNWIKKLFHKHKLNWSSPLVVSGYGLTEYNIWFCRECGDIVWMKTKDFNRS